MSVQTITARHRDRVPKMAPSKPTNDSKVELPASSSVDDDHSQDASQSQQIDVNTLVAIAQKQRQQVGRADVSPTSVQIFSVNASVLTQR